MENNKYTFQKLTPVNNADISVYEEAIDFTFEHSDIRNIAFSGAYSAGKSSILESYKAKHPEYKFVHLSLAHFRTPEQDEHTPVKESFLEGKILNQLIHQISPQNIPQTNFRIKKGIGIKELLLLTLFISLFIGSLFYLLSFSTVTTFIKTLSDNWIKNTLSFIFSPYTSIVIVLISISCSIGFIYTFIKAQKNRNVLRKISLQGNEIEIFEEQDDSYFDKYLNEVLYLFENADADVIVFEDMDRFNASRIFERLREVNTLINIQRKKDKGDKHTPLRFFYLLRDDIFISKDRTKFFDYIIPIVPVVDSSNSYAQFLKHLKDGGLLNKIESGFLQSLSLYIDDMRILKNIYNEFVIYIHRLNTTDLDWNKMMAMIAYKNLFPRDFCDLQLSKGFVRELFNHKEQLIEETLISKKEKKQAILARIKYIKEEILISQQELDDAFKAKIERLPSNYYGQISTPEAREKKQSYDIELPKRKQAIEDILKGKLPELELELVNVNHEISLIHAKSLKDLINKQNIEDLFSVDHVNEIGETNDFNEIKGSDYFDLLKFLIRNGYIDETYPDYMTYFYDDSLSTTDKTFLRRITDRRGADYTYNLKNPQKIIESPVLRTAEFELEETLNFDLLEYLLLNNKELKNRKYLETLLLQIQKSNNTDFISEYYYTGKASNQFVTKLNEQWPNFFSFALSEKKLPPPQIKQYSIDTLYFSSEDTINAVNTNNCLSDYISNCSDYLAIDDPNINRLIWGFSLINVLFISLNYNSANKNLFNEIYNNNFYELNFNNIVLMLKKLYGISDEHSIIHKNYSVVQSNADSPIAKYISEYMATYTEIIINNCNGKIDDDEKYALDLLNKDSIETDVKILYIEKLTTCITEITTVTDSNLWCSLILHRRIKFSISNFVNYFLHHGLDKILTGYIEHISTKSCFKTVTSRFDKHTSKKLFDAISLCNIISTDKYKEILVDLDCYFDSFNAYDIDEDKFEVLVNEALIEMTLESLLFVREYYKNSQFEFIRRNLDEYLDILSLDAFILDEALQIITWNINDCQKIELLTLTEAPLPITGKKYTDLVNEYIIKNNLDIEEMPDLYIDYPNYDTQTRDAIAEVAKANVTQIIARNMTIDDNLLSILLLSDNISDKNKVKLFTKAIPNLNEETCQIHFDELGLSKLKGIFAKTGGRRNYEKSTSVTTILTALKANNWIYDFHDDERNTDKYTIIKNPPRKELEILD